MRIKPIAEPRLYQRIAGELSRLIDDGTFAPGARLPPERSLARSLAVSRSSLREALSLLELDGRIEIRVGSGAYVLARKSPPRHRGRRARVDAAGETSPLDVLHVRRLVEAEAAALAARHATGRQIEGIVAAFERLARQMQANRPRPSADRDFHLCIADASGNTALAQVIALLWAEGEQPLSTRMEELFVSAGRRRDSIGEHQAILEAIRRRDPAAARRAMNVHLLHAHRQRLVILRKTNGDA